MKSAETVNTWTPDRIEILRTMWIAGKTAAEIAMKLGSGITRDAVIGKIDRLKRTGGDNGLWLGGGGGTKVTRKLKPTATLSNAVQAREIAKSFDPATLVDDDGLPDVTSRIGLTDLRDHDCRWCIGDPKAEHSFCGQPVQDGSSYCAPHETRSRLPVRR